jgi:hypothetical protein
LAEAELAAETLNVKEGERFRDGAEQSTGIYNVKTKTESGLHGMGWDDFCRVMAFKRDKDGVPTYGSSEAFAHLHTVIFLVVNKDFHAIYIYYYARIFT